MTLYLVEHFFDNGGVNLPIVWTSLVQAKRDAIRSCDYKRVRITKINGYFVAEPAGKIEFVVMCKEIVQEIRFEVEKL